MKEESLAYRRECPYDAMGDYSVFCEKDMKSKDVQQIGNLLLDIPVKQEK